MLVMEENKRYSIIESRHFTFNEDELLGAPGLEKIKDEEISDDDSESYASPELLESSRSRLQDDLSVSSDVADIQRDAVSKRKTGSEYKEPIQTTSDSFNH